MKAIAEKGFRQPTEIQSLTLPSAILGRKDILGAAETGITFSNISQSFSLTKYRSKMVQAAGKPWRLVYLLSTEFYK